MWRWHHCDQLVSALPLRELPAQSKAVVACLELLLYCRLVTTLAGRVILLQPQQLRHRIYIRPGRSTRSVFRVSVRPWAPGWRTRIDSGGCSDRAVVHCCDCQPPHCAQHRHPAGWSAATCVPVAGYCSMQHRLRNLVNLTPF